MSSLDSIAREHERTIDSLPQVHSLAQYPLHDAVMGLLRAYDSMIVVQIETLRRTPVTVGVSQHFKAVHEGFAQALRWYSPLRLREGLRQRPDSALICTAGEFLLEAAKYSIVAQFYTGWSRGLYGIEADRDPPRVKFVVPNLENRHFLIADVVAASNHQRRSRPVSRKSAVDGYVTVPPYTLVDGHVAFQNPTDIGAVYPSSPEDSASSWTKLLPDDTLVLDFTMGAFTCFWSALYRWSRCAIEVYVELSADGVPQEQCMPTQTLPVGVFLRTIEGISGLDRQTVERITEILTYTNAVSPQDIFLTPLIVTAGYISFSPHVIGLSHHQRNLLKRLSLDRTFRDAAATLNGSRAQRVLTGLGKMLERRGYQYWLMRPLVPSGDVDLLAYNYKAPEEVLVVEGKATVAVDSLAELIALTDTVEAGASQVLGSVDKLTQMSSVEKTRVWRGVPWERVKRYLPACRDAGLRASLLL